MPTTAGSLSSCFAGSREATEVLAQVWPLQCQVRSPLPGEMGSPNTHTSVALTTTAPPICSAKDRLTDQWLPFQRSAVPALPPAVNAQTFVADDASAATTSSPLWPANETCVHDAPLRFHAVGLEMPLKAQPPVLPTATTAVKSPPLCTCLTKCQDGPDEVAASAHADAAPVMARAVVMLAAAAVALRPHLRGRRAVSSPRAGMLRSEVLRDMGPSPVVAHGFRAPLIGPVSRKVG